MQKRMLFAGFTAEEDNNPELVYTTRVEKHIGSVASCKCVMNVQRRESVGPAFNHWGLAVFFLMYVIV